jgi:hypothetical protein
LNNRLFAIAARRDDATEMMMHLFLAAEVLLAQAAAKRSEVAALTAQLNSEARALAEIEIQLRENQ